MALKEVPKIGDKVRYLGGDCDDVSSLTIGGIYEIEGDVGDGDAYFIDDVGDRWDLDEDVNDNLAYYELVTEPQPDVTELLANIGRRLHEVETSLEDAKAREYYDEMVEVYSDLVDEPSDDAVNSPAHYKRGKYETIEVIEHITAGYDDPFVAYCVGNAVKYLDRAPYKHDSPAECLRKAAWYITRAAEHTEASE